MAAYHFSVMFEGDNVAFHGTFNTGFVNKSDIVDKAKSALSGKLEFWERKPENVVKFEVYQFINGDEENIFLYEKK